MMILGHTFHLLGESLLPQKDSCFGKTFEEITRSLPPEGTEAQHTRQHIDNWSEKYKHRTQIIQVGRMLKGHYPSPGLSIAFLSTVFPPSSYLPCLNEGARERDLLLSEAVIVELQQQEKGVEIMTSAYVSTIFMPENSLPPMLSLATLSESSSS